MKRFLLALTLFALSIPAWAASPSPQPVELTPFGYALMFDTCPSATACLWALNNAGAWTNLHVDASGNLLTAAAAAGVPAVNACPSQGACPFALNPSGAWVNLNTDASGNLLISGAGGGSLTASGPPTNGQLAQWTSGTNLQGFTPGSGIVTWLTTPSSANLRSALTDESGTGAAYFQGGDLGTPSAGVGTNLTGIPIATGISGLGTGVAASLAFAPALNANAMGATSSSSCANITGMTWNIAASKNYILRCAIPVTFAASATIQFCLNGPGSPTHSSVHVWGPIGASSAYFDGTSVATTSWQQKTTASGAPATSAIVEVEASIQNGSTASGTPLTLQAAANGTNNITILADASCQLTQVN